MGLMTIRPKANSKVLVNPGMGWTTFYSFNGDEININHPEASIAYFRFYWDDLEPEEGLFRWDVIDRLFEMGRRNGQKIALRVSAMDGMEIAAQWREKIFGELGTKVNKYYRVPEWFYKLGPKGAICVDPWVPDAPNTWEPDYGDPLFLEKTENFISALGSRYDGNVDLDHIDIGTYGRWGEWHVGAVPVPPLGIRKRIVDMYLRTFQSTPLLIPVSDSEALSYAVSHGAGWRADCLGDLRQDYFNYQVEPPRIWNHMEDYYMQQIIAADAYKVWKKAPVAFESGWEIKYWYDHGWSIDYILAYALSMHISIMNNKSLPIPDEWRPEIDEFSKKMGYRLLLKEIIFPDTMQVGQQIEIPMVWENKGVAPCYGKYNLVLRFNALESRQIKMASFENIAITSLFPGRHDLRGKMQLPPDIAKGNYNLIIALEHRVSKKGDVKLAIETKEESGWYLLGSVKVV
jgi:hypothetical protein